MNADTQPHKSQPGSGQAASPLDLRWASRLRWSSGLARLSVEPWGRSDLTSQVIVF
jgi:hypothetical protein